MHEVVLAVQRLHAAVVGAVLVWLSPRTAGDARQPLMQILTGLSYPVLWLLCQVGTPVARKLEWQGAQGHDVVRTTKVVIGLDP